jgi:beta-lactamase class A
VFRGSSPTVREGVSSHPRLDDDDLPAGTVVAHKTGTSGTQKGITAATNDIGIITLPNGRHLAIAVFVSDSPADESTREGVIAKVALAVWEKFATD